MKIGNKLRIARENANMTQTDLAKAAGTSLRSIQNYEKDEGNIALETLEKITSALGITLGYFLDDKDKIYHSVSKPIPMGDNLVDIAYYPDTYASAGYGATNHDAPPAVMRFDPDFLAAQLGIRSFKHLHIITARGDSMEPDIHDGGLLFVLPVENEPSLISGSVYVVNCDGEVYVKRLEKSPFSKEVKLHSDNKEYQPISVGKGDLDKCHFIGRVVGHFSRV